MTWTVNLCNEEDYGDLSIYTIDVAGSGHWVLIVHADGVEWLTTPSGGLIRLSERDWQRPETDPIHGILNWVQRYF